MAKDLRNNLQAMRAALKKPGQAKAAKADATPPSGLTPTLPSALTPPIPSSTPPAPPTPAPTPTIQTTQPNDQIEIKRQETEEQDAQDLITEEDAIIDPLAMESATRDSLAKHPEELGEFYAAADRLIQSITESRVSEDLSFERRLANLSKRGLSPPLPASYAHLLWFALPGDAALSLKLFDKSRKSFEDYQPRIAAKTSDIGFPIWIDSTGSTITRPEDSCFEVRYFPPKPALVLTLKEVLDVSTRSNELVRSWVRFQSESISMKSDNLFKHSELFVGRAELSSADLASIVKEEDPKLDQKTKLETTATATSETVRASDYAVQGCVAELEATHDLLSESAAETVLCDDLEVAETAVLNDEPQAIEIVQDTANIQEVENKLDEQASESKNKENDEVSLQSAPESLQKEVSSAESKDNSHRALNLPQEPTSPANLSDSSQLRLADSPEFEEVKIEGEVGKSERLTRLEIPRNLRRSVGKAIREFDMIKEGDRILVGLSGGKDSLTLLHILRDFQARSPMKFELAAATVDPRTPEYDPSPLIPYLESLGIQYFMLRFPIIEMAKEKLEGDSLCAFCARMKRGLLYSCMKKHDFTTLALGQHLDDIAESFLMSAFYNGVLNTMKAHYVADQNVRIIRPLTLVREQELALFAAQNELPIISDNCPACFAAPKERLRMKHLLASQEFESPVTFPSLAKALTPLMSIDKTKRGLAASQTILNSDECGGFCQRTTK